MQKSRLISELPALIGIFIMLVIVQLLIWKNPTLDNWTKLLGVTMPFLTFAIGFLLAHFKQVMSSET